MLLWLSVDINWNIAVTCSGLGKPSLGLLKHYICLNYIRNFSSCFTENTLLPHYKYSPFSFWKKNKHFAWFQASAGQRRLLVNFRRFGTICHLETSITNRSMLCNIPEGRRSQSMLIVKQNGHCYAALSTTMWRRMGKWRYNSMHFWQRPCFELWFRSICRRLQSIRLNNLRAGGRGNICVNRI